MAMVKSPKLCLATRFFNLNNGGIGRFSVEMQNGLISRGYNVVSVSTTRQSTLGHIVFSTLEMAYSLPKDCDIYHCLTPMEAIYAPKKSSIVTFHDLIPWLRVSDTDTHYVHGPTKPFRALMSRLYFQTISKIAAQCAFIVCNSEETQREVIEYLHVPESKVSLIHFGVNRGLRPTAKKDGVYRIGTLSYLDPRKRIDLLIQAFLAADIDGELVIGGTGTDYPRLKRMAQEDKRIKFVGFIPDENLVDFYNSLDLFVFPSKVEGYGLPIVEAFACKKPVILLSDVLITGEIKSRCTLVDNLTDFLKNPKHTQNIEENYSFARSHDWDSCVEQYEGLYRCMLGRC